MATAKKKVVHWDPVDIKAELLKTYPPKVARKRAKQIVINEARENAPPPEIVANVRTIPGIITSAAAPTPAARAWSWARPATSSTSPTARSAAASTPG